MARCEGIAFLLSHRPTSYAAADSRVGSKKVLGSSGAVSGIKGTNTVCFDLFMVT